MKDTSDLIPPYSIIPDLQSVELPNLQTIPAQSAKTVPDPEPVPQPVKTKPKPQYEKNSEDPEAVIRSYGLPATEALTLIDLHHAAERGADKALEVCPHYVPASILKKKIEGKIKN